VAETDRAQAAPDDDGYVPLALVGSSPLEVLVGFVHEALARHPGLAGLDLSAVEKDYGPDGRLRKLTITIERAG
jgi:hypothetical protein